MKQSNLLSTFWLPALLACFSLFACKAKQGAKIEQTTDNQPVITPKTEKGVAESPVVIQMPRPMPGPAISLKTTPAYGINPVVELRVFKDGLVTWLGKEDTPMLGHFEAKVNPQDVQIWLTRSQKDRYFELAENYPLNGRIISDFSNTVTFIQFEANKKTITNNYDAPMVLRKFEADLLAWANELAWMRVSVVD